MLSDFFFFFGCIGSSLQRAGLFVAVHGCSLVAESGDYSLIALGGLLFVVASLVAEHWL